MSSLAIERVGSSHPLFCHYPRKRIIQLRSLSSQPLEERPMAREASSMAAGAERPPPPTGGARTTSKRSGCRSPPTAPSRRRPRLIARAKDMHYYTPEGRPILDGAAGPVVHQRRPQPRSDRAGDPGAGGRARLRADLPVRPSARLRAGEPDRGAGAGRSRPRVLLQLRLGGRRHRDEDRAGLLERARPGAAHALHRPRARLSRRRLRRHGGRRARQQPQGVRRHAAGRRPPAAHLQPRAAGVLQGRAGMGRASGRRAGAHRRAARRHHHRRRDRRADGGLDRRAAGAEGLSAAAARDLRQVRHPADLRRGHHRLRPARPRLRRRALRRRARHDHVRQGRDLGLACRWAA